MIDFTSQEFKDAFLKQFAPLEGLDISRLLELALAGVTPGPWRFDGPHVLGGVKAGFHAYVECRQAPGGITNGDPSATARLIAACDPQTILALCAAASEAEALRAEVERYEDVLHKIKQWSEAYPIEVFPEPDLERANEVLKADGISLGAISAKAMRHVITRIQAIVDAASKPASAKGGE